MIVHWLCILVLALCAASCAYWLAALACLRRVLRVRTPVAFAPTVSILKPVKGVDTGALENFASFASQNYPHFEILFGVAQATDPAVGIIEQLKQQFPSLAIRLIVTDPLGANPKAAILNSLAAEAHGEVLVISDSDIRVTPAYLTRVVAPLKDPSVGLVTCLYRGQSPKNLIARLASLHMDTTFAPSAAFAWHVGTDVGMGATLVMRRADLERIGGYTAIADHLLDDNEVAARIARLGLRVVLSDYPVASVLGPTGFKEQRAREVRWARGIRAAYPLRYPGLLITFAVPLAIIAAAFSGVWQWAWIALPVALAVRWFVGWRSAVLLGQPRRRYLALLPIRDLLSAIVWCVGLVGHRVHWRGADFMLRSDGRLQPVAAIAPIGLPQDALARAIRRLDAYLRRRQGIFEFSEDPQCVLRVSVEPAHLGFELSDGTRVSAGERVGVVHLWNEHLIQIPTTGADMAWAKAMHRRMDQSLNELAQAAEADPRLMGLPAFGGTAMIVGRDRNATVAKVASRYGFQELRPVASPSIGNRFHSLGEDILVWGLAWAFNPGGLRGKTFVRRRDPVWISRRALLARHANYAAPARARRESVKS